MCSLVRTAAAVAGALVLSGCPDRRPPPVPGPQSAAGIALSGRATDDGARHAAPAGGGGVREISWFQGTFEEAFTRRGCHGQHGAFSD